MIVFRGGVSLIGWLLCLSAMIAEAASPSPRMVDVFVPDDEDYPRVRIPSLVTTLSGTLLAFAEGRQAGDHSSNDLILRRSTDGGSHWGKLIKVHTAGPLALNNPQAVVLPSSGRVILMYQRNKHGERNVLPGYEGPDVGYTLLQWSDDDGVSWSRPRDITRQVKRANPVTSHASGPGIGIVLRRSPHQGRILMPFNQGPFGDWRVYAAFSDDHGASWNYGAVAENPETGFANEVQMVELADGRILLNCRLQGGRGFRGAAWSRDGGESWSPVVELRNLIEPICQAALLRYSDPLDGQPSRILFSHPASQQRRHQGTIRMSLDEGRTWPIARQLYAGGFGYSCMSVLADGRIGILFERDRGPTLSFAAVPLSWLSRGDGSPLVP